jgi:hypothetical protein
MGSHTFRILKIKKNILKKKIKIKYMEGIKNDPYMLHPSPSRNNT